MTKEITAHSDILDHEGQGRDDDEQVTVWEPDADNLVHIWFESADGECSLELAPDERRRLIAHLQRGL